MRRPFLAGNWKMNLPEPEASKLAQELRTGLGSVPDRDVAIFPTFVSLARVAQILEGSRIQLGAQSSARTEDGAFTGEVSASILKSVGTQWVLVGHSERRQLFGESDEVVNGKVKLVQKHRLSAMVCVGETRPEREGGLTLQVVHRQIRMALAGIPSSDLGLLALAYEPVWAIGTGLVATPAQAQDVHASIRLLLRELYGAPGTDVRILYGGSVKANNIDGLMAMPDLDGALVGGASLKAEEFLRIVHYKKAQN